MQMVIDNDNTDINLNLRSPINNPMKNPLNFVLIPMLLFGLNNGSFGQSNDCRIPNFCKVSKDCSYTPGNVKNTVGCQNWLRMDRLLNAKDWDKSISAKRIFHLTGQAHMHRGGNWKLLRNDGVQDPWTIDKVFLSQKVLTGTIMIMDKGHHSKDSQEIAAETLVYDNTLYPFANILRKRMPSKDIADDTNVDSIDHHYSLKEVAYLPVLKDEKLVDIFPFFIVKKRCSDCNYLGYRIKED